MTDIVARLRAEIAWEPEVGELLSGAADEIERLRLDRVTVHNERTAIPAGSFPKSTAMRSDSHINEPVCPYVTGTVTRYCTLTPFTLTDAEREAIETSFDALQYAADALGLGQGDCDRLAATLRGLLERTKLGNVTRN